MLFQKDISRLFIADFAYNSGKYEEILVFLAKAEGFSSLEIETYNDFSAIRFRLNQKGRRMMRMWISWNDYYCGNLDSEITFYLEDEWSTKELEKMTLEILAQTA